MKRSIAIFVVALYGILSVGVHVHLHYCCGKLAGMHLVSGSDECCSTESHQGCTLEHDCCSYKEIDLSIQEDHFRSSFQLTIPDESQVNFPDPFVILHEETKAPVYTTRSFAVKRKLFLEHSSLIYYAG